MNWHNHASSNNAVARLLNLKNFLQLPGEPSSAMNLGDFFCEQIVF